MTVRLKRGQRCGRYNAPTCAKRSTSAFRTVLPETRLGPGDPRGALTLRVLRDLTERFDGVRPPSLRVPAEALQRALDELDPAVRAALDESIRRLRALREGTDHRALKAGIEDLNRASDGFAAQREAFGPVVPDDANALDEVRHAAGETNPLSCIRSMICRMNCSSR